MTPERQRLLEDYGRFYGEEHFAVAFTASTAGDEAKRVTTRGWDQTRPLPDGEFGAAYVAHRGINANPTIILRPSNLVVLECDSEADLAAIAALELPTTLTVRSSAPYKRHFYFRPPLELEALPYVAFRFESGKLTADSGRYFLAPPSLHPTGTMYDFLPGLGPADVDVVEIPEHVYRDLCDRARRETSEQRERIAVDPEAKILAGQRRDLIFRYACMLRRWGRPYGAILAECQRFNEERCEPPIERRLVELQVRGAMKKQGDQELAGAGDATLTVPIVFETLRAFLERDLPPAEALVGATRNGTNLLPRYGWVLPWGREGAAKTSVLVDLLFHIACGLAWLHYPVGRPVRVVAIVNEGIPGGLQDKLRQKLELWEGDRNLVLDNLAIYASPWGEFTFRDPTIVEHAQAFVRDFAADYLALDPLHTLGTTGAGSPQDTEQFKRALMDFGLWQSIGVITAHHSNKMGMVSGDWARHADTVIHLEKDGKKPATKFTVQKARPADPAELGVPALLEWVVETMGYRRVELEKHELVTDEILLDRIRLHLAGDRVEWLTALKRDVTGDPGRLGDVVRAAVKRGELINESTHPQRFRVRLRRDSDGSTFDDLLRAPEDPQTRMDKGVSSTVAFGDAEMSTASVPSSVVEGRRTPVRGTTTTFDDNESRGDENDDEDYSF